jgi:Transposase
VDLSDHLFALVFRKSQMVTSAEDQHFDHLDGGEVLYWEPFWLSSAKDRGSLNDSSAEFLTVLLRKLMLIGEERLDTKGKERLLTIFQSHDPKGELFDAWHGKEKVRAIYLTKTRAEAIVKLNEAISFCCHYKSGPELQTLGKTLRKWGPEILARHETGASNGKVEAANLLIKQIKRAGRGFRNLHNYRLRILLAGGLPCKTQQATKLRPKPRLIA